jgi:hypothetical protein
VLVIVLAVIVIAASTGIYLLLRYGKPTSGDLVARRKYSIRRRGIRAHPLPIGLPGSLGEKIGSVFKGRRAGAGAGWMPADDNTGEWGTRGTGTGAAEPLRERELDPHRDGDASYQQRHQQQREGYLRVGAVPVSRQPVLTESTSESTHKSRSASHVDPGSEPAVSFGREAPPSALVQALSVPTYEPEPDEEWFDADDTISGIADGIPDGSNSTVNPLGYFTSHPHRADSGTLRGSQPSEISRSLWNS